MRNCEITEGRTGFCGTRKNVDGELYTLVYGDISALESRNIEIKPFYHFYPGSTALTFSTWSCNFRCPWCQNHHLSRAVPNPERTEYTPPEKIVKKAIDVGDDGLCASFQEPTLLFEYLLDLFPIAKEKGLYTSCVSNGYMSHEALKLLRESGLDALKIDVKGNEDVYRECCGGVDVTAVWNNVRYAIELGIHVEIVNLVVTGVNDTEDAILWLIENHLKSAGADIPLHFTRYFPAYEYRAAPTTMERLRWAYRKANGMGVTYPYVGNVYADEYNHTYCPECGEPVVKRKGHKVVKVRLTSDNKCMKCGNRISITGNAKESIC